MRRLGVLTAVVASLVVATTAMAATPPYLGKATGSVGMTTPMQYASFNAFDYGATGDRGTVTYTNFEYGGPGSGVWRLADTTALTFVYGGDWIHTMLVDTVVPTSPSKILFSGTGYFNADPSYTWTFTGLIDGSAISFSLLYTGTSAGYALDAVGTIAPDGSVSGTSTDNWSRSLPWSMPAGSAYEVFSYTAAVTCAVIGPTEGVFGFTIPLAPLTGIPVVVRVVDGGSPGTGNDSWMHGVGADCTAPPALGNYPIVSGNLTVH